MKHGVIRKADMGRWFDSLKGRGRIYGPKRKENAFVFAPVGEFAEMTLEYIPTILPPKKYYFPQKETLFRFKTHPYRTEEALSAVEEFILFGVHTCDIAGIQCLDVVFRESPECTNYLKRKEKMTIIGLECMDYCDRHASCAAVGAHVHKGGYDVMLTDIGAAYVVYVKTEKGERLVQDRPYIRPPRTGDEEMLIRALAQKAKNFRNEFKGTMAGVDEAFARGFHSPVWADLGRRCVGCTNCTTVCPTCYCFDMVDDVALDLGDGARSRVWSNCQMDDFARVATGEDFRPGRDARQRHRYYRKFQYSVRKYDKYFCTGCGRCTRTCMAGISLVETVNSLLAERGRP
jgi:sulfhydrogenase subunit beta (sulfur reductase)